MYLGNAIVLEGMSNPMANVPPLESAFSNKPQGHGYTVLKVKRENSYFPIGTVIKGHEFHYSRVSDWHGRVEELVFSMERGTGFLDRCDGVRYRNVLALYTHVHALGTPDWAPAMVRNARRWQKKTGQVPE